MANIRWDGKQLKAAGINKSKLTKLVRLFDKVETLMKELGLVVYGSDGCGYLIHNSQPEHDKNGRADHTAIVADCGFGFDGGGW